MTSDLSGKILGLTALEACAKVFPGIPNLAAISLLKYKLPPSIQNRVSLSKRELMLINKAASTYKRDGNSYLETLVKLCANAPFVPYGVMKGLVYHQKHSKSRTWIKKKDFKNTALLETFSNVAPGIPLALCSTVRLSTGSTAQIALLDFHVAKTQTNHRIICEIARTILKSKFMILETDRSYHAIGLRLLTKKELRSILSSALLFSPIIDHAYIAHQLIEGEATLRITRKSEASMAPKVTYFSN